MRYDDRRPLCGLARLKEQAEKQAGKRRSTPAWSAMMTIAQETQLASLVRANSHWSACVAPIVDAGHIQTTVLGILLVHRARPALDTMPARFLSRRECWRPTSKPCQPSTRSAHRFGKTIPSVVFPRIISFQTLRSCLRKSISGRWHSATLRSKAIYYTPIRLNPTKAIESTKA